MRNLGWFFSTIKGGYLYKKPIVLVPLNKFYCIILKLFYNEGYINGYFINLSKKQIIIFLKYFVNKPVLGNVNKISIPSYRNYKSYKKVIKLLNSGENLVLSSSHGIFITKQLFFYKTGGEVLFIISL